MSRAFMKERDDLPEPPPPAVVRSHPNYITPRGLERLRGRAAASSDPREREALERSIESAVVVEPPAEPDVAALGATVTVAGAGRGDREFTIVGEDEVDVEAGLVSFSSPLGEALIGARAGDRVLWHRPAGDRTLTVKAVAFH